MQINNGPFPIGIRIKSSAALTGVANKKGSVAYESKFIDGMYRFVDPSDDTADEVDAGGLIDYGGTQILLIKEVRAHLAAGKKITVTICDRDGDNPIDIVGPAVDGEDVVYAFGSHSYVLLTSQVLQVVTDAGGTVDIYSVIAGF